MRVAHLHVGPVHPILEVELQGEERQGVQGLPGGGGGGRLYSSCFYHVDVMNDSQGAIIIKIEKVNFLMF